MLIIQINEKFYEILMTDNVLGNNTSMLGIPK